MPNGRGVILITEKYDDIMDGTIIIDAIIAAHECKVGHMLKLTDKERESMLRSIETQLDDKTVSPSWKKKLREMYRDYGGLATMGADSGELDAIHAAKDFIASHQGG